MCVCVCVCGGGADTNYEYFVSPLKNDPLSPVVNLISTANHTAEITRSSLLTFKWICRKIMKKLEEETK